MANNNNAKTTYADIVFRLIDGAGRKKTGATSPGVKAFLHLAADARRVAVAEGLTVSSDDGLTETGAAVKALLAEGSIVGSVSKGFKTYARVEDDVIATKTARAKAKEMDAALGLILTKTTSAKRKGQK